jgi:Protein of unknown function DUF2625
MVALAADLDVMRTTEPVRGLEELVDLREPGIARIREWLSDASVPAELLPPSAVRDDVLLRLQITTRSPLGALAYDSGGLLIDGGWLRFLGSGHARLPRDLFHWNDGRAKDFFLVGDDAVGGFFAINGGALGPDFQMMYYWAPDDLEWAPLDVGFGDLLYSLLHGGLPAFYEKLRWPTWSDEVATLSGDRCFAFYPFLWVKEGSLSGSHRAEVPVAEAFDLKVSMRAQLSDGA